MVNWTCCAPSQPSIQNALGGSREPTRMHRAASSPCTIRPNGWVDPVKSAGSGHEGPGRYSETGFLSQAATTRPACDDSSRYFSRETAYFDLFSTSMICVVKPPRSVSVSSCRYVLITVTTIFRKNTEC